MLSSSNIFGPTGLYWLWKAVYGHGFWAGFSIALFMTPILVQLISTAWTGYWPTWDEHFKSFVIGDPLLAIAVGILAILASKPDIKQFTPSYKYWNLWLGVGFASSLLYIANDFRKDKLELSQLLQPHIFYHHIILFTIYVALIGSMTYVQYRRKPRDKLWLAFVIMIQGYFSLIIYDTLNPPSRF